MTDTEIRWIQRLDNYKSALSRLRNGVDIASNRPLSELEQQGLIQAFEFTHELAWKLMKDFFVYQGNPDITGSRDGTREAFKMGLISQGESWMKMIASRNQTSHTYNQRVADEISNLIQNEYAPLLVSFCDEMTSRAERFQDDG